MGYPHPDILLKSITSKQLADWMAFATLEQVGEPVPPDKEKIAKAKKKEHRDKFEGGMRSLMTRRD